MLKQAVHARADAADHRVDRLLVDVEVERVGARLVDLVLLHVRVGERRERLDLDDAHLEEIERRLDAAAARPSRRSRRRRSRSMKSIDRDVSHRAVAEAAGRAEPEPRRHVAGVERALPRVRRSVAGEVVEVERRCRRSRRPRRSAVLRDQVVDAEREAADQCSRDRRCPSRRRARRRARSRRASRRARARPGSGWKPWPSRAPTTCSARRTRSGQACRPARSPAATRLEHGIAGQHRSAGVLRLLREQRLAVAPGHAADALLQARLEAIADGEARGGELGELLAGHLVERVAASRLRLARRSRRRPCRDRCRAERANASSSAVATARWFARLRDSRRASRRRSASRRSTRCSRPGRAAA